MKRSPVMEFFSNATLFVGACAFALAAAETVLRLTVYNFPRYPKSPGPNAVYHIDTPEFRTTGRTNSHNMRDTEIPPKTEGEFRVLCLGDSFTFGLGVNMEDAYPQILGRVLREEGRRATVINGGTGGAATEALEFLKRTGFGFEPDVVVEQLFVGNDFYDGMQHLDAGDAAPVGSSPSPSFVSRLKEALKVKSVTADFVWNRLIQLPVLDRFFYRMNLRYSNRGIYLKEDPELEKRLVEFEFAALREMNRVCRERGVKLLLLVVPEKQQLFMRGQLDAGRYDLGKPNRLIAGFCAREGIPAVDMAEIYKGMSEKELRSFYYAQDMHWTARGNRHAAATLARALRS